MIINHGRGVITKIILFLGILITKIYSACVPLTGSTVCPSYASYSIDTVNGVFPLTSQPNYTDVASFDAYILKYVEFLTKHFVAELAAGGTCNAAEMETYALANLRYVTTFACNFIINSKANKCQAVKPKVCKTTCNDFVTSYQGLVNQFNACLNQATVSKSIASQNSRCTKATSNFSAVSQCIDSSNESNCGFTSAANSSTYCSANAADACCTPGGAAAGAGATAGAGAAAGAAAGGAATSGKGTKSSSKAANVNSASASGSDKESENGGGSGGSSKVYIIVGGCCAVALIGALFFFYKKGEKYDDNDNNKNSLYEQENRFPPFQPEMEEKRGINNNPSGFSGGITSPGMTSPGMTSPGMTSPGMGGAPGMGAPSGMGGNNNNDGIGDVLVSRTDVNNNIGGKMDADDDEFNFGSDSKNYNFTSNVTPGLTSQTNLLSDNDGGFNNAALYAGAGAAAVGAAAVGMAAAKDDNKEKNDNNNNEMPKPQMVNMTNIQPPESQNRNESSQPPEIKIDEEPKPQMVNMTNIQPPESQNRNETDQAPEIKIDDAPKPQMVNMTNILPPESQNRNETDQPPEIKIDDVPKPQMVNMTNIQPPESQNRNTKFLSTYSEVPDNQRVSSQYYGEDSTFDFSSSKINITSQLDNNNDSVVSSNRVSTSSSSDKELDSTPYRAIHTYEPQLNDELLLEIGDIVEVVYAYDDGWIWGINTRTNESGACPMLCLEKVEESEAESEVDERIKSIISTRESMISRDSVPGRRDSRIAKK